MRQLPPTRRSSNVQNICGDQRLIAVAKGQLGTVRIWQRRYDEALAACHGSPERSLTPWASRVLWLPLGIKSGIVYRYTRKI